MKKIVIALSFLMAFQEQVFAVSPQEAEEFAGKEIVNATYLGQDDENLYVQTETGEALILEVGLRPNAGFRRIPGTNCYGATSIVYAYCFGKTLPVPDCSNKRHRCPTIGWEL